MYNQTIFSIFFFISGLFNFTFVHAQSGAIMTSGILQSYLGKIGATDYFVSYPPLLSYKSYSHILSIKNGILENEKQFKGSESSVLTSEIYNLGNKNQDKFNYTDWFIFKNNIYSIFQNLTKTEVELTLYKYDSNLNTIDSVSLFRESIQNHRDFNFFFKQIDNQIGIIAPFELSTSNYFSLIYDLNSEEQTTHLFTFNESKKMKCTDFTINQNQDFIAVFEGPENYAESSLDVSKILNFIIYSAAEKVKFKKIESITETEYSRSFKMYKLNENEVLLGGLNFHSTGGKNIKGYRTSIVNFGEGEENDISKLELKGLENVDLWRNNFHYEKFLNNKFDLVTHYQHLKEILPLGNGDYLFISEAHSRVSNNAVSNGHVTTSGFFIPHEPDYFSGNQIFHNQENWDIFISNLNPASGITNWSTKTKKRHDMIGILYGFDSQSKSYFLDIDKDQDSITILYPDYQDNFGKKAKGAYMASPLSDATTITKFQISLSAGTSKITEFTPKVMTETKEALTVACSYIADDGQVILCTQSRKGLGTKNYIKFHPVQF